MSNSGTALITGASSGIGLHLAREFARHGHPVVLVAPVEAELRSIAAQLSGEFSIGTKVIAKDLTQPASPDEIHGELSQAGLTVDFLVNDAGLGQLGHFWETPLDRDITMIRLNIEAVVRMTKLFLPPMIQRKRGRILNVASIAGFEPGPRLAVYHATKAFVLSFSESLATELQDTGVTLTALCPGATDTDFFRKAEMEQTRAFQKNKVMSPQEVAEQGYDALMRGDRIHVPGAANKTLAFARRFLPDSAQAKFNEKLYEDVPPEDQERSRGDVEFAERQKN